MKWFKHDTDAHSDPKITRLEMKYGFEGVGLYWTCIELIAARIDANNLTFELEHDAEVLAHRFNTNYKLVLDMMSYMVDLGLFERGIENKITCLKLAKRLDQSMTSNPQMRGLIAKVKDNHDGVMTVDGKVMQDKTRLDKNRLDKSKDILAKTPPSFRVPAQAVVDLYHKKLPKHPQVIKLTPARRDQIKARWREDLGSLEEWEDYFDHVSTSDFLTGKVPPTNGRSKSFMADLEWLTKQGNIAKVVEGKYHG